MATDLATPSNTLAKMRFEEPYVSEGLNKKLNGLVPAGVIRGGKLTTSGVAMNVTIQDDPVTSDSVYSFIDSNGHQVTFRQQGNVTLNLTSVASTFVYIGLEITYTIGSATVVKWRAFSLAEAEADLTLVIIGSVDVPASGLIAASSIDDGLRRTAWQSTSQYAREAVQVTENGAFELVARGVTGNDDNPCPGWDWVNRVESNVSFSFVNTGSPQIGDTHLQMNLSGLGSQIGALLHKNVTPCRGGETVKVKLWIKGDSVTPGPGSGGHMGIRFEAADENPNNIVQTEYIEDLTLSGTFAYTEIEKTFQLDSSARWFGFAVFYDDDNNSSSGDVYFDNVRVWVEQPQIGDGQIEQFGGLNKGDIVARGLGVAKPWTAASTIEEFVQNILSLRNDGSTDTYSMSRGDQTLDFLLKLINGDLEVENLLTLGANKVSTDLLAQEPRITSEFKDGTAGTAYTLLWELENSNGSEANLRLYATGANDVIGTGASFAIVSNASFDSVTDTWSRDQAVDSWRLDVSVSGVAISLRDSAETDGWDDSEWVDTANGGRQLLEVGDSSINLKDLAVFGENIANTAADRAIPRLEVDLRGSAINSYTCLMKFDSITGTDDIFLYGCFSPDTKLTASQTHFSIVVNAVWNGTQWARVNGSVSSQRYDFSLGGFAIYRRGSTDASPWNDSDWDDSISGKGLLELETTGAIGNSAGSLLLQNGFVDLGSDHVGVQTYPAVGTEEINTLYSKNIVKAWARIGTGSTNPSLGRGFNINQTSLESSGYQGASNQVLRVPFAIAFDNALEISPVAEVSDGTNSSSYIANAISSGPGTVDVVINDNAGVAVNLTSTNLEINLIVMGLYD